MRIELPWPSPKLFPNYKRSHHWRTYRSTELKARTDGYHAALAAIRALGGVSVPPEGKIAVHVTFVQPDRRKRDDDGMIGAIKNYRDGIADALGCDDARFRCQSEFPEEPEKPGRVIVEVML